MTPDRPERAHGDEYALAAALAEAVGYVAPNDHISAILAALEAAGYRLVPAAATGIDVDALASVMHDSTCAWKAHAGFMAKTDTEYHRQRAALLAMRYEYARLSAEPPQVIEGYVNPDGKGKGNWWKG